MDFLTWNIAFKKDNQKLAYIKCGKWQHRRCYPWINQTDYRFQKQMGFICSLCRFIDSNSPLKEVSPASDNIQQSRPKMKINKPTHFSSSPPWK
ncbi:Uncharacterized protein APZ42_030420 [Daphnia magna]|uniref:Uncharacterized protein n=1 Tax=Daphnia magna TaxID=35525 RepID=A0A164NTN5_9CRUS|nr:Uncharacterized protein APZ42_030420 [Daphnia magna]